MVMKKNTLLLGVLVLLLLLVCASMGASQELRLELNPSALEKLSATEGALYIEWGNYRNT